MAAEAATMAPVSKLRKLRHGGPTTDDMKREKEIQTRGLKPLPGARCSPDRSQPLISYETWIALGPEKAAEYLARRMGLNADRQLKLTLILEVWHDENPPNAQAEAPDK